MPSINISEDDFGAVASAACHAQAEGRDDLAARLDKIARKINAALSNDGDAKRIAVGMGFPHQGLKWQDVPSVLRDS